MYCVSVLVTQTATEVRRTIATIKSKKILSIKALAKTDEQCASHQGPTRKDSPGMVRAGLPPACTAHHVGCSECVLCFRTSSGRTRSSSEVHQQVVLIMPANILLKGSVRLTLSKWESLLPALAPLTGLTFQLQSVLKPSPPPTFY